MQARRTPASLFMMREWGRQTGTFWFSIIATTTKKHESAWTTLNISSKIS